MRAFCVFLLLLLCHCGAGAGPGAKSADGPDAGSEDSKGGAAEGERGDDEGATEEPRGPSCEDGTCSLCGDGICPSGWYCDENATGGPACSWLTECADDVSCSCVTRVLGSACKCREESGGIKVSCD